MRVETSSLASTSDGLALTNRPHAELQATCEPPERFDARARAALLRAATQLLQAACAGVAVVALLWFVPHVMDSPTWPHWRLWAAFFPPALLLLSHRDEYRLRDRGLTEKLRFVSQALYGALTLVGVQTAIWLAGLQALPLSMLTAVLGTYLLLATGTRVALLRLARRWRQPLRIAVVGADAQGLALARHLRAQPEPPVVVGFVDDRIDRIDRQQLSAPFLGRTSQFVRQQGDVDAVVIAMPNSAAERVHALAATLRNGRITIYLAPELPLLGPDLAHGQGGLGDMVLLGMERLPLFGRVAKRLFDIAFSSLALVAFLPFGLVIAVLIKLESSGPVIFHQKRYGQGYRLFDVYKFRSMCFDPQAAQSGIRLTERGDSRVTRIGGFLRRTSLDEFPQFINVLLGQMSVAGPRPHPPGVKAGERVYEEVVADFMERYKVRPGITGWAQVSGLRGNTFTEGHLTQRFAYDIEYIRNWSFELDLWIIMKTVVGGFRGKNAF